MIHETIELRKLIAENGMTLYNGEVLGKEVYLGKYDDPENWQEISDEEADAIRAKNNEILTNSEEA